MSTFPLVPSKQDTKEAVETETESIPIETFQQQIHEAELKTLLSFYEEEVLITSRGNDNRRLVLSHNNKECSLKCNRVAYSYPDSAIWRHVNHLGVVFAGRAMELGYRYCMDCKRIMPASEVEKYQNKKKHKTYLVCPCCSRRLAYLSVLIRKTKMRDALFRFEGY